MTAGDLISRNGQLEWGGLLMGDGTIYRWRELTGWDDLPAIDSGNVARTAAHGAWSGTDYLQSRTVGFTGAIRPTSRAEYIAAKQALRAAVQVAPTADESLLVIRTHDETLQAFGKPSVRIITGGPEYGPGILVPFTLGWICSDPRLYALGSGPGGDPGGGGGGSGGAGGTLTLLGPSADTDGLIYPLEYPLDYGVAGFPSEGIANVGGNTPTDPTITFNGPVTGPRLQRADGRTLQFDVTIAAGEALVVTVADGSALLAGITHVPPTSSSVPIAMFTLIPGPNSLTFRGDSFPAPGASCVITWHNAFL